MSLPALGSFAQSAARRVRARPVDGIGPIAAALMGLVAIALVWTGILTVVASERGIALRDAAMNAESLARAFAESTNRSVAAIDQALLSLRRSYTANPATFDFTAWVRDAEALADMTFLIGVVGRDGELVAANMAPPPHPANLGDREYFRFHRDTARDELFIARPVVGRSNGRQAVQLSRRITASDGTFAGVVVIGMDPGYLSRFYEAVGVGPHGSARLVGLDGVVRASTSGPSGDGNSTIGRRFTGGALLPHVARQPAGTFRVASPVDGIDRIYAYRRVGDLPLVVNVGIAVADAVAPIATAVLACYALGVLATALIIAVAVMAVVRERRMRRVRETLRAQYEEKSGLLEVMLGNISQGLLLIDAGDRVRVWNRPFADMFGLPPDVMAGEPAIADILRRLWESGEYQEPGGDFETWLREFRATARASGRGRVVEHTRPNGVVLEVRSKTLPNGSLVRTYTDITERKLGEDILRAARDTAQSATRAKSEFLATMSHEIRSPLSGLIGVLGQLDDTSMSAEQAEMVGMARNSGAMLLAVLNDILDFSKIEAGALTIAPRPTALHALLGELARPHIAAGRHKSVEVSLSIAGDVPAHVMTDGLRLRQIIGNLLSNAVKFTAAGTVAVRVARAPDSPVAGLRFAVRDTGIGMSAAVLDRLFQPFMQADGSTTRNYGGTGLGLTISRQLARMMGGTLSVTSRPGAGSEFVLTLPCPPCAAPAEPADGAAGTDPLPATVDRKRRVLVVDDDKTNRWLLQRQLRKLGCEADVAEDGEKGLAVLMDGRFDLLVTDCHMPRMDGVALTRAVRAAADPSVRDIPIVGLTADTTDSGRERCLAAGMNELAIKPLRIEGLRELVARLLPDHEGPRNDVAVSAMS